MSKYYLVVVLITMAGCTNYEAAKEAAYQQMKDDALCVEFGKSLQLEAYTVDDRVHQGDRYCLVETPKRKGLPGYGLGFHDIRVIYRYRAILKELKFLEERK